MPLNREPWRARLRPNFFGPLMFLVSHLGGRFLLLLFLLHSLHASDIGLIRVGESWRYFKGVTNPAPANQWTAIHFNDESWLAGRSGFVAGLGGTEVTTLPDYNTTYHHLFFRKPFVVTDTNNIAELVLRIDYDDGFVAYLNGMEVVRRGVSGLPNEPVPHTLVAPYHPRGFTEEILITNSAALLQNGTNLLAVQVLGSGPLDTTACFVPELLANVTRGPFLQNTTPTSAQVIWKTLGRASGAVEFGTNLNNLQRLEVDLAETNHIATLANLRPDTQYHYRILNRFGARETYSDWSTLRTFKLTGRVTFNLIGDSGWATSPQFQIAEQLDRSPADFLMHVGDIVYGAITHFNSDLRCFSVYHQQMRTTPWFVALGNHEMYADPLAALQSFYLPTNSATGTEHYYSFDHGDVHFVVTWGDLQALSDYKPGSAQHAWLEQDLARTTKPWKFMFFHHTWRSSSYHGYWDDYDRNLIPDSAQLDASFGELARRFGVQIVFNGHDHCYERLAPSNGPISFISGGGGADPYAMAVLHPDSSQFHSRYHFLRVTVEGDMASVEAVGIDGNVFDRVHLDRTFPSRQPASASWHSSSIVTKPVGDTAANTLGQVFDFTGAPITAPMGLFTSPGRLFVNNDKQHLYLGLDEVMLRPGEELFLFLEVPGLSGLNSLRDLGNGLVDPAGEGADGLDFLANLAFDSFSPSVGVVLGDEFGDGPARDFLRTGQTLQTGQGAFYLTNGLTALSGQRLAQFNHSPQIFTAPYEKNADFIELALPYSALGGLKPGDMIKVGVITALRSIDTNSATQARHLDTSGIGYSVRATPAGTILEGVAVRLADDPDPDSDGLATTDELQRGTNPNNPDSDGDGLNDGWEVKYGFNPLTGTPGDITADPDADSLSNLRESQAGTDPFKSDTDDDSLPDPWEVAFGLNPAGATGLDGPTGDPDADGLTNLSELRAGTHPKDPQSRLDLRAISVDDTSLQLTWSAVIGKRYRIQFRDSFSEPFRDLEDPAFPRTAQAATETFTVNFSPDLPPRARYYRVQLVE
jgi:hypothetical protein